MRRLFHAMFLKKVVTAAFFCLLANFAAAGESERVRVGIFTSSDYYGQTFSGQNSGYGYSYLDKIQQYAPVTFEYVYGTREECVDWLEKGEIDLLDCVLLTPDTAQKFRLSKMPTGIRFVCLFTLADNENLWYNGVEAFDGLRVGFLKDEANFTSFAEFAVKNQFEFQSFFFDSFTQLSGALTSGEIDAGVTDSLRRLENEKTIARFDPRPFFMATAAGKPEIGRILDEALEEIQLENFFYNNDLYKHFYEADSARIILSRHELEYIKKRGPIVAVYDSFWAPFESYNRESKSVTGINVDILKLIADKTGLAFTFLDGFTYDQAIRAVSEGKVDMLLSYDTNPVKAAELGIVLSNSFLSTPICIIGNQSIIHEKSVFAIPRIYPLHRQFIEEHFASSTIFEFDDITDCYAAIEDGRADFTMENIYAVTNVLKSGKYSGLVLSSITTLADNFSFAFRGDIDPILVEIFNKGISSVSYGDMERILLEFSTTQSSDITFSQFLSRYRGALWLSMFVAFFVIVLALIFGIRAQIKNKKMLWRVAYTDDLTGLGNLNKFKEDVKKLLMESLQGNYVIIKLDVEHFNLINEMYGFSAGDRVLKFIATELSAIAASAGGFAGRIASDHFVMLCEKNAGAFAAQGNSFPDFLGERVSAETRCAVQFSVGRYFIEPGETDIEVMYEKVNYAHREAKKNPGTLSVFDYDIRMKKQAVFDHEMESRMVLALDHGEFKVFMQPKFRLNDEKLAGAEALVRWVQESSTVISPAAFIPLFERNGFITRLDMYMFEGVCKILAAWISDGIPLIPVSVNFSRLHLHNRRFVQELAEIADRYMIPRRFLEIELTETALLDAESALESVFIKLHKAGFALSMDDFGTGYSSLGLLKNLPVDVIKIDRSFFSDTENSKRAKIVIANVMSMAKELKIITVAEGVEQREHIEFLRETGCDLVQGFYYSKPMPAVEFTQKILGALKTDTMR